MAEGLVSRLKPDWTHLCRILTPVVQVLDPLSIAKHDSGEVFGKPVKLFRISSKSSLNIVVV